MANFPSIIELELTARCNKKCKICQRYWHNVEKYNDDLKIELLEKILSQIGDHQCQINLGGLGESLLVTKLPEILKFIKTHKPNVSTGINTNGALLTEEKYDWLTDGRLDYFTISLNAPDGEGYQFIVGDNDYEKICTNAKKFLKFKNNNKPFTTVHCFNLPIFANKENTFKKEWGKLADFVQIRELSNWVGTVPIEKFGITLKTDGVCDRPFVSLAIDTNGIYHNCCGTFYLDNSKMGINNVSISEYWNGDFIENFRNLMLENNIPNNHICFNCSAKSISPNTLIERKNISK